MVIWEGEIHLKFCLIILEFFTNRVLIDKILQNKTDFTDGKSSGPRNLSTLLSNEERS